MSVTRSRRRSFFAGLAAWVGSVCSLFAGPRALADGTCKTVEVRFLPQGAPQTPDREPLSPQIAVWVEDKGGKYIDTLYVTRTTGVLGLGNRSGQNFLKGDHGWPYGKRPMVLPVWAHQRNHSYPLVVMGGQCSPNCGGDRHNGQANPDDEDTVAYHGSVSSAEPFYCSPSGWRTQNQGGVDVVSCASAFYSSKGRFEQSGQTSLYPPRADIDPSQVTMTDSDDVKRFAALNDLAAVSGATFASGKVIDPPVRWAVPRSLADGDYVIRIEVSMENDFNQFFGPGLSVHDEYSQWDAGYGKQYLGQPSIVYSVPFHLDDGARTALTADYDGYGDVRGQSGELHPPDLTISKDSGSGADRLKSVSDGDGSWRVKAAVVPCGSGSCTAPAPVTSIELRDKTDTTMTVRLHLPDNQAVVGSDVQVRYRENMPITEENFSQALPASSVRVTGSTVDTNIKGLLPKTTYYVAARLQAPCGAASTLTTTNTSTEIGQYTTLSGCFIATAAYGSPMMAEVGLLRAFRDQHLLTSPLGQLGVASYYAMSPALSGVIRDHDTVRGWVRQGLAPLVGLVRALADNQPSSSR